MDGCMKAVPAVATTCLLLLIAGSCLAQQTSASATPDDAWHFELSPYLWFAGTHGTVGSQGRNVGLHASAGDLLSHLDIGLMGAAEARYKRFVLSGNLQWIRLSDSRALPLNQVGVTSADVRVGQLVWTSQFGYRVVDHEKVKADANIGVRFWNLGQKFELKPIPPGVSFDGSQNWADILIGGRIQFPVSKKAKVTLLGDVGGWNASAKLDYSFAALLGYHLWPKWTVRAGYGYQFVDYRGANSSVFNAVTSGALIGVTYRLK
jgi:hypothetical protein